ncbi:MAG TPA: hypothetical protein VGF17_19110 [Phytomonospora sp.]
MVLNGEWLTPWRVGPPAWVTAFDRALAAMGRSWPARRMVADSWEDAEGVLTAALALWLDAVERGVRVEDADASGLVPFGAGPGAERRDRFDARPRAAGVDADAPADAVGRAWREVRSRDRLWG